jgi:putative FmdB family regulatory protein
MPLYEYRCESCGHTFEVIQRFSDAPIAKCPACGGAVQKLLSPPSIRFKGTGWYVTDYAKKGEAKPRPDGETPAASAKSASSSEAAAGTSSAGGTSEASASPAAKTSKD